MLNPSTADEYQHDPTIKRCIGFARLWKYGGVSIYNIFAYRSTDPKGLKLIDDPVGPDNDEWLKIATGSAALCVAAWGNHGAYQNRSKKVIDITYNLATFGLTKQGEPKHPLYLPKDASVCPLYQLLAATEK